MKVRNEQNHKGKHTVEGNYTKEWRETTHAWENNDANADAVLFKEMVRCQTSPIVFVHLYTKIGQDLFSSPWVKWEKSALCFMSKHA